MPKIVVKQKAEVSQEYTIPVNKKSVLIGSEPDNDLIIDDKKVSMNHMEIYKEGNQYYIKDLKSAFGTYLNGEQVEKKVAVQHGDTIQIGQHSLIFQENGPEDFASQANLNGIENDPFSLDQLSPNPSNDSQNNIQATSFNLDLDTFETPTLKTPITPFTPQSFETKTGNHQKGPQANFYLLAIYGPYRGKKFLLNQIETKIGRDTKLNDIVIRMNSNSGVDSSISRRHATIRYENGNYYITDKRSKTRTFVNQHKVGENDNQLLIPGDEIEIVSDQQSTIFRLCAEQNLDFAPPKKAGVWWIRFRMPIIHGVSAMLLIFSIILLVKSFNNRSIIAQHPDTLTFTESVFFQFKQADDNLDMRHFHSSENFINNPAVSDLNKDGYVDVLLISPQGQIRAISGETRKPLWEAESHIQSSPNGQLVLSDVNRDHIDDIIFTTTTERLLALDGKLGAEIWSSAIIGGSFSGPPVVADINGDGRNDVAVGTETGKIICALCDVGEPTWITLDVEDSLNSVPSAGDLTGDGLDDFIFGTEAGNVYIYHGKSNKTGIKIPVHEQIVLAQGDYGSVNSIRTPVSIGNFNRDFKKDIIVSTSLGNLIAINSHSKEKLWMESSSITGDFLTNMYYPSVVSDFDEDQFDEVVTYTLDGRVRVIKGTGEDNNPKIILWEYPPEDWEKFVSNPALADMNKDGVSDIVISGVNHGIYVINGKNGKLLWKTNFQGKNPPATTPIVADLDNDSYMDILVVRSDNNLYQYRSNVRYPAGTILWGQRFGNSQNNGNVPPIKLSNTGYNINIILALLIILGIGITNFIFYKKQELPQNT